MPETNGLPEASLKHHMNQPIMWTDHPTLNPVFLNRQQPVNRHPAFGDRGGEAERVPAEQRGMWEHGGLLKLVL